MLIKRAILSEQSKWILYWNKSYARTLWLRIKFNFSCDSKGNKHNFHRRRDFIKRFCSDLKELGTKTINYEQNDMIFLTDNENKFYEEPKKMLHMPKRVLLW